MKNSIFIIFILINTIGWAQKKDSIPIEFYINNRLVDNDHLHVYLCGTEISNPFSTSLFIEKDLDTKAICSIAINFDSIQVLFDNFSIWSFLEFPDENSLIIRYYTPGYFYNIDIPAIKSEVKSNNHLKWIVIVESNWGSKALVHFEE